MEEWWSEVGLRLSEPTWFADVGLPTLASIAALFAAYHLFRAQVRHERRSRAIQRQASVVNEFGRKSRALLARAEEDLEVDLFPLADWARSAEAEVPDLFPVFSNARHLASEYMMRRIELVGWHMERGEALLRSHAASTVLEEPLGQLWFLAMRCASWDGESDLPTTIATRRDWDAYSRQLPERHQHLLQTYSDLLRLERGPWGPTPPSQASAYEE